MRQDRRVKKENEPQETQENRLVLGGAQYVVAGIIGELEDVGREGSLLLGGVAILCGILEDNGAHVAVQIGVSQAVARLRLHSLFSEMSHLPMNSPFTYI